MAKLTTIPNEYSDALSAYYSHLKPFLKQRSWINFSVTTIMFDE
jgi:hypothetical protein